MLWSSEIWGHQCACWAKKLTFNFEDFITHKSSLVMSVNIFSSSVCVLEVSPTLTSCCLYWSLDSSRRHFPHQCTKLEFLVALWSSVFSEYHAQRNRCTHVTKQKIHILPLVSCYSADWQLMAVMHQNAGFKIYI